ncbi:hypothetical protein [Iningainema tapete]|uniref:hypothetical protein n=1 Tax=Iningainema tapete TaxID=2806730 RepID=UPI003B585AF5
MAIAFFFGIDIFLGAFISGTLSTLIIAWILGLFHSIHDRHVLKYMAHSSSPLKQTENQRFSRF